jgi:hypothetical protein
MPTPSEAVPATEAAMAKVSEVAMVAEPVVSEMAMVTEPMVTKVSMMMAEAEVDARPAVVVRIATVIIGIAAVTISVTAVTTAPTVTPMAVPPAPPMHLVEQGIVR